MEPSRQVIRPHGQPTRAAFTFTELLVVIGVIVILAAIIPEPGMRSGKHKAQRITCVNNLKQIGTAYHAWSSDRTGNFPASTPVKKGGWQDLLVNPDQGSNCWTNYALMAHELGTPRILVCPSDERSPASEFSMKGSSHDKTSRVLQDNTAVSYFVGVGAANGLPNSILGGDRNLSPGLTPKRDCGFSPPDGRGNDVTLGTNYVLSPVCWSQRMHSRKNNSGAGNILMGDGGVQQCSSTRFRTDYQACAVDPNISKEEYQNNWPKGEVPKEPSFRLIFP